MDVGKTLEELENDKWGEPKFHSRLVTECHRLRTVPLSELGIEDLRILIGQKIGLKYLVPLALDILESNPLAAGNLYRGDLLANVAKLPEEFWASNPALNNRLCELATELEIIEDTIKTELLPQLAALEYR